MAKAMLARDAEIHRKVLEELEWDTRVSETDVGVEVDDGVVTLTGHVDGYAKRVAAEEAAHRVPGVQDVANDIEVHFPGSADLTDTHIAQAVRRALEDDVFVPDQNIETTVTNGWVILKGDAEYWRQREEAERAIHHVPGVRGITNTITVRAHEVQPFVIRQTIEDALTRRAEREAEHIALDVQDGIVTLSGTVRTWRDRRAVLGAASHARGVRMVVDRLHIDPNV